MVRIYKVFITLALVLLAACQTQTNNVEEEPVDKEPYEGKPLKIAVVGEIPNVKEKQINIKKLSLDKLYNSHPDMYDAVFIMENHLSEASNQKYVGMYKKRKVPFFFVGSKANTIPFQDLENPVSYEEEAEKVNDSQYFMSGILYVGKDEGYRGWKFPYPINENQQDNIKEIYSKVFKVVEKESNKNS